MALLTRAPAFCFVTGEYPPQPGGVSDYTQLVAAHLARGGAEVHVIAPGDTGSNREDGVQVHRVAGNFSGAGLRRASATLGGLSEPRRLVVQWVPHAFGMRALNVRFCWWVYRRATAHGDHVELMIHEAALSFAGSVKQRAAAAVHRVMLALLLRAARRVHVSTPAWIALCRPYALGRRIDFTWTPVPSNIPVVADDDATRAMRRRIAPAGETIVAHFGTYGAFVTRDLLPGLERVLDADPRVCVLLIGPGGAQARESLARGDEARARRIHAPGKLEARELSSWLRVADLFVQPYADGASARRGSAMAVLAHGRTMVTTDGPATEAPWRDGGAVLVPAGDVEAMVSATLALAGDAGARARVAAAGERLYAERFDVRHTVDALLRGAA